MSIRTILGEIITERLRQTKLYGVQTFIPEGFLPILGEEFGEVCRAIYEKDDKGYREELIHVAAVAVQMVECFDRTRYNEPLGMDDIEQLR